jgi:hypothetical protein
MPRAYNCGRVCGGLHRLRVFTPHERGMTMLSLKMMMMMILFNTIEGSLLGLGTKASMGEGGR